MWQAYLSKVGLPSQREDLRCAHLAMHGVMPWMKRGHRPRVQDFVPFRDPWERLEDRVMSGDQMWAAMMAIKARQNAQHTERMHKEGWH